MKITTMTIIKDVLAICFITGVLFTDVNNWWTILGIAIIAGNYSLNNKNI